MRRKADATPCASCGGGVAVPWTRPDASGTEMFAKATRQTASLTGLESVRMLRKSDGGSVSRIAVGDDATT